MDNGGSGDGAPLSICCASLLTQMLQPQPSCLSAPSTAVPCPCSAEGLQRVLLGPVCTRTTRTAQGVLWQLSGPMASAVVGIQRSVHVKAGVQKASLSIALGQKSCAISGGTCRPCCMQAEESSQGPFIYTVSHISSSALVQVERCQQIAAWEWEDPNTEHPCSPSACHDWKDLNNQRLHPFVTSLPKVLQQICFSLAFPPQTFSDRSPTSQLAGAGGVHLLHITTLQNGSAIGTAIPGC